MKGQIRRLIDLFIEVKRLEIKLSCPCLHVNMFNQLTKKILILDSEADELMESLGLKRKDVEKYLDKHPELFRAEGFVMQRKKRS